MSIPSKAPHDLRSRLMPASAMKKLKEGEIDLLAKFVDLLDKMLTLDPAKRISPKVRLGAELESSSRADGFWFGAQDMLSHPFLRS